MSFGLWSCVLLSACCLPVLGQGYQTPDAPLLGSAWYPEQWPETAWEKDLALMEAAHFNVVRIGEFAWSTLEPSEGRYQLDWMERAVALAAKHHLKVVIGTPTDAPPAWLTTKYPETRGMDADGRLREHGGRRQFNYDNPHYRLLCAGIVRELGRRFGHDTNVLGWQIGNEYTDESFDAETTADFDRFLSAKFGTVSNLNSHWSTNYGAWSQVPLVSSEQNPGLQLEHKHFVTATWLSFQQNQIDALRPLILSSQFVTTNIGGLAWSDNWDHYAMTAPLDLASWDEYVGSGHLDMMKEAMLNDFVRGWKRQNFWVMETQPGTVNWSPLNNALYPDETRALAWQAIGHGADAILYWQWRPALNGQEEYHGSVVGPDREPNPLYAEVQQLGAELALVRSALRGTSPHAEIALLHTYDSRWAIDFQPFNRAWDQQQVLLRFYEPLEQMAMATGQAVDIIDPQAAPLAQYKALIAPALNVIDDSLAAKLVAYVRGGGHLLLGPRSGMKDAYSALNVERQPGPLGTALGAAVSEFYALPQPIGLMPQDSADLWAEAVIPNDHATRIDFTYSDDGGWLDHQPAMVTRMLGSGSISYLGTLPDAGLMRKILEQQVPSDSQRTRMWELPPGVELCVRSREGLDLMIVINHNQSTAQIGVPGVMRDLLNPDKDLTNPMTLPGQGVAVLTRIPNSL